MITIVEAQERDIPAVMEIERASITPPWSEGTLLGEVGRVDTVFKLAVEDGQVSGFFIVRFAADEAELYQIAVRESRRKKGIGDALMTDALAACRARAAAALYLEVRKSNAPALMLYKKHGFVHAGRRKNYYSSPVEDAIVLSYHFEGDKESV
ncbi:ribosomal protein S18-alanine N-acetyltransferase [Oscillospiraceae bacterium WX1]